MVVFRWHSPRIACTWQAIKTPRVDGKLRFNRIVRMLRSHGQCCPQFAPIWGRALQSQLSMRTRPFPTIDGFREAANGPMVPAKVVVDEILDDVVDCVLE